mgnify:CR=1 FL=1
MLLLDGKYLTEELVENEINKSDFISEVFLGIYGSDNDLFKYSSYYKNIKNIDEILFEQLKDILKSDPYKFIKSSDRIIQNKKINFIKIHKKFIKIIVQEEPYENHRCKGRNHPYPHEKALPYCFCGTGSFAECAGEDLHRRRSVGHR